MSEEKPINHLIPWTLRGKLMVIYAIVFEFILLMTVAPYFTKPMSIGGFPELWVYTLVVGSIWVILAIITGYMKR